MPDATMSETIALAFCQQGHKLAWLVHGDKQREIHYWVAAAGLALRTPGASDNGHYNYAPHEAVEPLVTAESGGREVMCHHRHGGEGQLDFADLLPVMRGESPPLVINV